MAASKKKSDPKVEQPDNDNECSGEVKHYIKTLDENKQISRKPGPLTGDETHRETTDEKGEKRIKRERFSAI